MHLFTHHRRSSSTKKKKINIKTFISQTYRLRDSLSNYEHFIKYIHSRNITKAQLLDLCEVHKIKVEPHYTIDDICSIIFKEIRMGNNESLLFGVFGAAFGIGSYICHKLLSESYKKKPWKFSWVGLPHWYREITPSDRRYEKITEKARTATSIAALYSLYHSLSSISKRKNILKTLKRKAKINILTSKPSKTHNILT